MIHVCCDENLELPMTSGTVRKFLAHLNPSLYQYAMPAHSGTMRKDGVTSSSVLECLPTCTLVPYMKVHVGRYLLYVPMYFAVNNILVTSI